MAYSDYGGYAYRNGDRVEERSDCSLKPDGTVVGSPGQYPPFAAEARGEDMFDCMKLPTGHVVLGDSPIFVALHKYFSVYIYRGGELVDAIHPDTEFWDNNKTSNEVESHAVRTVDFVEIDVVFRHTAEGGFGCYVEVQQADSTIWHGWTASVAGVRLG